MSFVKGIDMCYGVNKTRFLAVQEIIQNQFVGPDSFWVMPNNSGSGLDGCLNCFGNAWWIPFPPTLVSAQQTETLQSLGLNTLENRFCNTILALLQF